MLNFIREGGVPGFVSLAFALTALLAAMRYATRPNPNRLPAINALFNVVICSSLLGSVMDFYVVTKAWQRAEPEMRAEVLVVGLGESLTPLILGLAFLSVSWMFIAVGQRRHTA